MKEYPLNIENLALRRASDEEYERLRKRHPTYNPKECPTCLGEKTFKYRGEQWDCNCELQRSLSRHYYYANISKNYQTLGFDDIYEDKSHIETVVLNYIDRWYQNKRYGRGIIFIGPLGTGKTLAQILILKELVKLGEKCWFTAFSTLMREYIEDRPSLMREMREAVCLAIDEVLLPVSDKQRDLYEEALEYVVRYRVENLLPTLIGTNLKEDDGFKKIYPRVASLVASTFEYKELLGDDTRVNETREAIDSLINLNEVRPIK